MSHKDRVAGQTIYQTNERTNERWRGTNIYTTVDNTMLEKSYDAYIKYLTNILKEKKKKERRDVCVSCEKTCKGVKFVTA